MAPGSLGEKEGGLQVDVDDCIPIRLGKVDGIAASNDARIVDKDVEAAKDIDRLGNDAPDWLYARQVRSDRMKSSTSFGDQLFRFRHRGSADGGDRCAGFGKRNGDSLADAGIRAGDDRGAAREIKRICHTGHRRSSIGMWSISVKLLLSPAIAQMKL